MPVKVLLVDDHGVVRQGLRMYLKGAAEIEVVGEAANGKQALQRVEELQPDVVLMDLSMPVMDGIAATAEIRRTHPAIKVVALTSVLDDTSVVEVIRAGAIGYLLKDSEPEALCRAIRAAAAGQVQLAPEAAGYLLQEVRTPAHPDTLTRRETDVLKLLARGRSNKDIAAELFIDEATVKTHVAHVLGKLGVQSRTQAALHTVRMGLVAREDSVP